MTIPKEVRALSVTLTICVLIFSLSLLYRRKTQSDAQKIVEAEHYVSHLRTGTSILAIDDWIKTYQFDVTREENNGSNPFAYSMFADAKLSRQNVKFYMMVWSKNELHTFHNPRHSFVFFFDGEQKLVKAVTLRIAVRGVSF